ncbi:MAG TPA: ABC transporter ATP-binding protein [Thermoplasmatales archaeon]|nr:ABC transporter ATP-binding protein [Thermoplasmatales archaeon]
MYAIEVRDLSKTYGSIRAVDGISFHVNKGEIFGFLGPNGAGKTTTIKSILGFIHPDSGEILINGIDINANGKEAKRGVGYLSERVSFYDNLTAYQNLNFYADMKMIPKDDYLRLLEEFDLLNAAKKKVKTFSKGMKQRLGLVNAFMGNPSLIILDEPSNGLDPRGVALVRKKILQMKEIGTTIFISSHILSEIQAVCDRVAIINKGKIVATDSVEKLGERLRLKPKMIIKLEKPSDEIIKAVESISGVESVSVHDNKLEVVCESSAKSTVILTIEERGGKIVDIKIVEPSLEDVFLRYTEDET